MIRFNFRIESENKILILLRFTIYDLQFIGFKSSNHLNTQSPN